MAGFLPKHKAHTDGSFSKYWLDTIILMLIHFVMLLSVLTLLILPYLKCCGCLISFVADMSSTAFIEPLPVIDFVSQLLNRDISVRPLSDSDRVKV